MDLAFLLISNLSGENIIDFKIIQASGKTLFRSPLSGYFEAEIHVSGKDFDSADKFLYLEW